MRDDRLRSVALLLVALAAALYCLGVVVGFIGAYADLLGIFTLGWLLAFILNPLTVWVSRPRLPRREPRTRPLMARTLAVLVVYAGLGVLTLALVLLVAPLVLQQLQRLIASLPSIMAALDGTVDQVRVELGLPPTPVPTSASGTVTAALTQVLSGLVQNLSGVASGAAAAITNLILILVFALYLNLGGPVLGARVLRLLPQRYRPEARVFMRELDRAFGGFLRGQTIYAALSAALALGAVLLAGAPFPGVVAIGSFLLTLIPLLGSFLGLIPPVLSGMLVSVQTGLVILVVLGGIQLVLTNAVMPKIFGSSIRLEPIVVFIAIVVGIRLAGIWGAIFGIPIAALAIAMAQYTRQRQARLPAGAKEATASAGGDRRTP
jgi:predicted PurR-regulated permease PerM